MKHLAKPAIMIASKKIIYGIIYVFKTTFLCCNLIIIFILLREGAFSFPVYQSADILSAVIISLSFAACILTLKGNRGTYSSEVTCYQKKVN